MKYLPVLLVSSLLLQPVASYARSDHEVRESTIVYKLKENATPQQLKRFNSLVNQNNIIYKRTISGVGIDVVKLKNIKGFEKSFSDEILNSGAVKFAEPDVSIPHEVIPNDTFYNQQWHHTTINSPDAWETVKGSANIMVCVLDTGVDTDHPDLIGNLLTGINFASTLGDGETPNPAWGTNIVEDYLGHGTGTSGTIGAVGDNLEGVSGVAWDIGITPVKINFNDDPDGNGNAYYSDMIQGIEWCADQGAKVANLSYGGADYFGIAEAAQYLRDSGGLLFMSAGNAGIYHNTNSFPDYSSFVAVGATDNSNLLTNFSEYGPYIDVVAPGSYIRTTYLEGKYVSYSGTSFSSPIAAGIAALVYSIDPSFTPAEVESYIFNTATDLGNYGEDDYFGHGLVNAGAAIFAASNPIVNVPPVVDAVSTSTYGTVPHTVEFDGKNSYDLDGQIVSYVWDYGDLTTGTGMTTSHTYVDDGDFSATLTVTDDRGDSSISSPIHIQVDPNLYFLGTPTNLSASIDGGIVTLSWEDNSTNEHGYHVERASKVKGKYLFESIAEIEPESTTFADIVIEIGSYKYRVRSNYEAVFSDYSNEVPVKVETISVPPDPDPDPTTLTAPILSVAISGKDAVLSWQHDCPTDTICDYTIDKGDSKVRGIINFSEWVTGTGGFTYPDMGLESGTYYYRVKAVTDGVISDYSNTVSARIK